MRSVYIVNSDPQIANMYRGFNWAVSNNMVNVDLVQFTGGEDVHPSLYGEDLHEKSSTNYTRDVSEQLVFSHAIKKKIPMVGICRGAQFLNVMCGGSMWQHVDNHGLAHQVFDTINKIEFFASSTHHQMMKVGDNGLILGAASEATYKERKGKTGNTVTVFNYQDNDPEVVFYGDEKCLCFQPHPEFDKYPHLVTIYFAYIEQYLFDYRDAIDHMVAFNNVLDD